MRADSKRQPAARHTLYAGHAGHPSGSVHHAAVAAASGISRPVNSCNLAKGSVHEAPVIPPKYARSFSSP